MTPAAGDLAGRPVRWGVIGTGVIASLFARDLALVDDAEIVAVGSRRAEAAAAFGERFGIERRHGSYEQLVRDSGIDAVYVATPAPAHAESVRLAISAGRAVLCEKPFTIDATQARELVAEARAAGTFLMEAMWTRFLPHVIRIRELLAERALGDVRLIQADVGQQIADVPGHRLLSPQLGGGALLDLGVYPVSLAWMVLGPPSSITAASVASGTGVDLQTSVLLEYDGGAQAVLSASLDVTTPTIAAITGHDGRLEIEAPWYKPTAFTRIGRDGQRERAEFPVAGRGMQYQVAEVGRCLRAGLRESPVMPLDETVAIIDALDEIRRQIGLAYPTG
jgi:predicted dehydrogenase